ncbi:MAG: tyrosine-type recombinase/integrase [Polyangiaceae bacterium]
MVLAVGEVDVLTPEVAQRIANHLGKSARAFGASSGARRHFREVPCLRTVTARGPSQASPPFPSGRGEAGKGGVKKRLGGHDLARWAAEPRRNNVMEDIPNAGPPGNVAPESLAVAVRTARAELSAPRRHNPYRWGSDSDAAEVSRDVRGYENAHATLLLAEAIATRSPGPAPQAAVSAPPEVVLSADLFEQWKHEAGAVVSVGWWKTRGYHYGHIAKHFASVTGLTSDALQATFKGSRLTKCSRESHKKERGTLVALFDWLETKEWGFKRPALPKLGKKDRGTRDKNRKIAPVELSAEEVEAIIARLPVTTSRVRRDGGGLRPIRDPVTVEWDTSLRPSTIERVSVPEHWQPERPGELFVAGSIDKEEYERTVRLTPRVIEVFERRARALPDGKGLLFGEYQRALRGHWYQAATAAGIDERRATKISVYDFRHAAGRRFLDTTGDRRGASFMLGHRNGSSTDRYTRPDKAAGDRLVEALAGRGASAGAGGLTTSVSNVDAPLDVPQGPDYMAVPPREGGGIG